ncbi:MAG TPA: cell envelope biogenesis protein TolA [Allosphingosinicella sp.]
MDRTEATAVGVAVAGHAALLALLGMGFAPPDPTPKQAPIEIEMVTEEAALVSTAPSPSVEEPAPMLAPQEGAPAPAAAAEPMPEPVPIPRIEPTPAPRVVPTPPRPAPIPTPAPRAVPRPQPPRPAPPQPKPAPPAAAKPAPKATPKPAPPAAAAQPRGSAARPTGRLNGLLSGLGARDTPSKATAPPAKAASAAVKSSLGRMVREQLKPHWKSPTGADAELLRTELSIWLSQSGAVTRVEVIRTTGQTASNRPQVKLHQEQAVRAARLASPFRLPSEYYDEWKHLSPIGFDKRLSQ